MKEVKNIVIVGGGTAGLITALMLKKRFENFNIKIVKSKELGIIGVGEGSTEHWVSFMDFIGLDFIEVINETNATLKTGILFNDWLNPGSTYVHSINGKDSLSFKGTLEIYNNHTIYESHDPYCLSKDFSSYYLNNDIPSHDLNYPLTKQFHFDTYKLNSFLSKKCLERNIIIEDHFIKDYTLDNQGNINLLITDDNIDIKGDFFIDCSGFKRILSSKLGTKWISYKDYLPVNQAITLSTNLDLQKGIEPYTKATALKNGWAWKIPTQDKYGNGYVFSNEYTTSDKALDELNKHLGVNVEKTAKNIKFEAGKINNFWNKNCVSIGLAGSFVEPLEAQSIGFTIIQTQALIDHFDNWLFNPKISKKYNSLMDDCFNNIVDYVQSHYFTKRDDSPFWKNLDFKVTEFNLDNKDRFSQGRFTPSDFNSNPYLMFHSENFYQVYFGLGIINKFNISKTLQENSLSYNNFWHNQYLIEKSSHSPNKIPHIDYLNLIKQTTTP